MSVGRQIGEFSYEATSVTVSERADGSREHAINFQGTAAGYGAVVATMRVHIPSPSAKGGRVRWTAHAYLENGNEAEADGDGTWTALGGHRWRVRSINGVSDGGVLLGDGVLELATRSFKGKLYAWD
jgi:hypothetical protein